MEKNLSLQQMRSQITEVRNEAQNFNSITQSVFTSGEKLDSMWDGDANDQFKQRMAADRPRFDDLFKTINAYCQACDDSANDYETTERKIQENNAGNQVRQSR
jgi:WXG100 family type VII secretion target